MSIMNDSAIIEQLKDVGEKYPEWRLGWDVKKSKDLSGGKERRGTD